MNYPSLAQRRIVLIGQTELQALALWICCGIGLSKR